MSRWLPFGARFFSEGVLAAFPFGPGKECRGREMSLLLPTTWDHAQCPLIGVSTCDFLLSVSNECADIEEMIIIVITPVSFLPPPLLFFTAHERACRPRGRNNRACTHSLLPKLSKVSNSYPGENERA